MTTKELWDKIAKLPKTSAGLEERLRLLESVTPVDDDDDQEEDHDTESLQETETFGKRTTRKQNYYFGVDLATLTRWVSLREVGLIVDIEWFRHDPATGVQIKMLRLVPPIVCEPIPEKYNGRLGEGLW